MLDEIGEMPAYLQTKLLRVLQEREYRPIGSDRFVKVDFRLICATNIDLEAALRDGRLREDLYFRINTIMLRVPPLRERTEDIPLLCDWFVEKFARRHQKSVRGVSPAAYHLLIRSRWPGNVRELENAMERAVLVTRTAEIQPGGPARIAAGGARRRQLRHSRRTARWPRSSGWRSSRRSSAPTGTSRRRRRFSASTGRRSTTRCGGTASSRATRKRRRRGGRGRGLTPVRLVLRAAWRGVGELYSSEGLTHAASIAFYALLSLFPVPAAAVLGDRRADHRCDRRRATRSSTSSSATFPRQFDFVSRPGRQLPHRSRGHRRRRRPGAGICLARRVQRDELGGEPCLGRRAQPQLPPAPARSRS